MARGKRRRPLLANTQLVPEHEDASVENDASNSNDVVDDYVAKRHTKMLNRILDDGEESDSMGDEPENVEQDVLGIDMSSSEADSDDGDDDDNIEGMEEKDRRGWGGRRRNWYGGDTHEYEIMENEEREEAFRDEEEEALRMQAKALSSLRPEDFRDDDDDEDKSGDEDVPEEYEAGDEEELPASKKTANAEVTGQVLGVTAPEVPLLVREMLQSHREAGIWEDRVHWNEVARLVYHLHASFVSNVAYYLYLRTDPESEGVDIRTHPVLARIVRIRSLLERAKHLPCVEPKENVDEMEKLTNGRSSKQPNTGSERRKVKPITESDALPNGNHGERKKKSKKRKKARSVNQMGNLSVEDDEALVTSLLETTRSNAGRHDEEVDQDRKRRKLNQIVGAMERERKNSDSRRMASADVEYMREVPNAAKTSPDADLSRGHDGSDLEDAEDDDDVMQKMIAKKAKKEARKARLAAEKAPHVYRFKDDVDPEEKRKASSQIVKNRGLTRYRPRDKKTPRTKNRLAYGKAVVRRRGAVRDFAGKPGGTYSGEASGINMSARKGSKLS